MQAVCSVQCTSLGGVVGRRPQRASARALGSLAPCSRRSLHIAAAAEPQPAASSSSSSTAAAAPAAGGSGGAAAGLLQRVVASCSLADGGTLLLAAALGGAALLCGADAALAAPGDGSGAPRLLGDLAENEDFWGNVLRYISYFFSVLLGTAYIVVKPILELLKRPGTAVLVVAGLAGLVYFVSFTVSAMLGLQEPLDYTASSIVTPMS